MAARGPDWAAWVDRLPALVQGLYDDWDLRPDGWMMHGFCALVVPVLTDTDSSAMLKIAFPEEESEHEHLALGRWAGRGAVRLLRADPRRRAMLLDALRDENLHDVWDVEACTVVGELYALLHVPALPQLRTLSARAAATAAELTELPRDAPLPRRLVEQAASLARDFAVDPSTDGTLVHTDLHYTNVLMSEDGDWLAIDPKPLSGDPHFEPAPMLWNRYAELAHATAPDGVRTGVRRRFHTLVDVAGLDEDRARDWVVVRMVANVADALVHPDQQYPAGWTTACIAVAKAVQD